MKPRYYKLERNAIRRAKALQALRPSERFYIALASNWKWAVHREIDGGYQLCA